METVFGRRLRSSVGKGEVVRVSPGVYALTKCDEARLAAAKVGGVVSHLSAAQYWGWKVKLPRTDRRHDHRGRPAGPHRGGRAAGTRPFRSFLAPGGPVPATARPTPRRQPPGRSASRLQAHRDHPVAATLAAAKASPRTGRAKALKVVKAADGRAANPFESVLRAIALEVPGLCVVPQQRVGDIGFVDLFDHRLGYTVVRFTWEEVMFHPDYVRAVLMDLVALGPRARAVGRRTA